MRIARHGAPALHQTFLKSRGDAHLHAKLIGRAGLALAGALHIECMQRAQLVFVLGLVREYAARACEQIADLGLRLLGQCGELARHFVLHAAHASAQSPHGFTNAPELLGVGVAVDLRGQSWGHSVVVLARRIAVFLGHLHQMAATPL